MNVNTLALITRPTMLQAQRESDGSLTVAVPDVRAHGLCFSDYSLAEMNGHIEIVETTPLATGYIVVNYFVN